MRRQKASEARMSVVLEHDFPTPPEVRNHAAVAPDHRNYVELSSELLRCRRDLVGAADRITQAREDDAADSGRAIAEGRELPTTTTTTHVDEAEARFGALRDRVAALEVAVDIAGDTFAESIQRNGEEISKTLRDLEVATRSTIGEMLPALSAELSKLEAPASTRTWLAGFDTAKLAADARELHPEIAFVPSQTAQIGAAFSGLSMIASALRDEDKVATEPGAAAAIRERLFGRQEPPAPTPDPLADLRPAERPATAAEVEAEDEAGGAGPYGKVTF